MSKETYNLQIPIPTEMAEELKILADEDDRSLRAYCRQIIKDFLATKKNPSKTAPVENAENTKDKEAGKFMGDFSIKFED